MASKIDSIQIAAFRGATTPVTLSFKSHPVVLVFGENGTGKSTVADAFDLICNREECGSLSSYSITSSSKYVPSLGKPASAIRVGLSAGTQSWTASFGSSGVVVDPLDAPDAQILRRRTILRLIEGKPKDRYEALKELIDVPKIESAETALRAASKSANDDLNDATSGLRQATDSLDSVWSAEGKPGAAAMEWAKTEVGKDQNKLKATVAESADIESQYAGAASALAAFEAALTDLESAKVARAAAEADRTAIETNQQGQSSDLLRLLREAKTFVGQNQTADACPVCEQTITAKALSTRLQARIDLMQNLAAAVAAFEAADRLATEKRTGTEVRRRDFFNKLRILGLRLANSTLLPVLPIKASLQGAMAFLESDEYDENQTKHALLLWNEIKVARDSLKSLGDTDRKSLTLHSSVNTQVTTVLEMTVKARELEALSSALKTLLEIVSRHRKKQIDGVLQTIGNDVERLYSQLHPGESLGGVRFFLKPNAIGSLEFDATFHGTTKVPPQAYYSESHLDTLGICVFFARAKLFKTDRTIIVLDDVLTSVDAAHLQRFMAMLQAEAVHFSRIIVLTHYRPWRDQYRWVKGPAANTQVIELGPWTLADGLNASDFVTDLEALEKAVLAKHFDRQVVASKAGIALESLLDFLTVKYRGKVRRNSRNEYTLGDLVAGLDAKLLSALRVRVSSTGQPSQEKKLKTLIEDATSYTWIRNAVGCHLNVLSADIPDADVKGFGKSVVALAKAITCPTCRALPTRKSTGSYWQCECKPEVLELHPLVAPGSDPASIDEG